MEENFFFFLPIIHRHLFKEWQELQYREWLVCFGKLCCVYNIQIVSGCQESISLTCNLKALLLDYLIEHTLRPPTTTTQTHVTGMQGLKTDHYTYVTTFYVQYIVYDVNIMWGPISFIL